VGKKIRFYVANKYPYDSKLVKYEVRGKPSKFIFKKDLPATADNTGQKINIQMLMHFFWP
jgi:hypothetical protein